MSAVKPHGFINGQRWKAIGKYIAAAARVSAVLVDAPRCVPRLPHAARWCPPPAAFPDILSQLSRRLFGL